MDNQGLFIAMIIASFIGNFIGYEFILLCMDKSGIIDLGRKKNK